MNLREMLKQLEEAKKTKDTTNSTTLSTRTTEKINSLVSKLQDMSPNDQKYAETQALLMTRLQFTDKQMKEGRVNFGKAKDQLKNKQDLINALAFASTLNFENSEEYEKLQERLETFVEFGNESKKIARQKERTKAVLLGATIGAATAATAWMITDYFRSEDLSQTVKDAIDTNPDVNPPVVADPGVEGPNPYNPTDFEVSVDASSRGAIATFEDLQEQLEKKYPDMTKAPAHIQEFMSKTPTELAIEENMYRPSDASGNESAKIYKGGKLGFNKAGELVYTDTRNGVDILSGDGKFDGQHFDYKTYSGNVPPAQEFSDQTTAGTNGAGTSSNKLHPGTPWETDKPWLQGVDKNGVRGWTEPMYPGESTNDNIFAGTGGGVTEVGSSEVVENMNTGAQEGLERIKLSEKLSVDFEIIEDAKGRPQTKFHNVNLNNFNAYHKAYLQQDLSAYARGIATNSDFLEQNPGMTAEKVDGDLRKLTNQMIMRDQVLQEGGLDPKSDEYKILRKERDAIQKVIRNNFEWYSEDSLLSRNVFDGNKYPDPNYVFENPVEAPGVQRPSAGVETTGTSPEISKTPGAGTVEINTNNTEAAKDIKFSVTRNEAGDITELKAIAGTLDPSKVSLQEFGYDPKWLDKPEFPQTFKDTPTGKKLISDLDMVKGYVALRETLPQGSDEYNYLNETIKNRIERIESKYPSVFN
jgi:hypothetical protein